MASFDYDLLVIGAGSGGVRAARVAAGHGAKVAIVEASKIGGTCVNRGCVPKKLLVYASRFAEEFEDARGFGWTTEAVAFDWPTLIANKDAEIERLNKAYVRSLEAAGVEIMMTRAGLDGHTRVSLADRPAVTAGIVLVATGARPFVPQHLLGRELAITSDEAFHLERLPRRIAIVGGGYIAVEFAGIFSGLGVETVLIHRGEQILRGFDDDLRHGLAAEMGKKGIEVRTRADVLSLERSGQGVRLTLTDGQQFGAGLVMYATGRIPNTQNLGLKEQGIAVTAHGAVKVDEFSQSSVGNVYAIGDVTNRINLTPVAIREGHAFADTVFGGTKTPVDHLGVPTAVFSQPELGSVGLTEAQARAKFSGIDVYKRTFRPMKHTLSGRDERVMMKLLVEPTSDKVVGCHLMGPDSGEMIQLLGIALKAGVTKAQFDATTAVHPTAAEELVTLRERWQG